MTLGGFAAFGFFASRLPRLRSLDMTLLPMVQMWTLSERLWRMLVGTVGQRVAGGGEVLANARGGVACTEKRDRTHKCKECQKNR
jgi:hypothetical protein